MESCVTVIVTLATEIQHLIEQNESLAKQTNSLLIFISTLQTALSPLVVVESLPHAVQENINGNIQILTSSMQALKSRELQVIEENGFTLGASKLLIGIQKRENDLRNLLKGLQVNWDLIHTLNNESKFNAMRLISHPSAKRFWATHFGAEIKYAEWNDFKHTMREVYCVRDNDELFILEKHLCQDNKVSVYSFDSLTRSKGAPSSFWHLIYSENKEKAQIALEEEHHVVDQLFQKLTSISQTSGARIGVNAKAFMTKLPDEVTNQLYNQLPDYGVKRVISLGYTSSKKLQEMGNIITTSEVSKWLQVLGEELKTCISQITFTLNSALSDGLCQRLLSPEVMEARIKKITTHLSQKGFVEQILASAESHANSEISKKISEMPSISASESIYLAATPFTELKMINNEFGKKIQELMEKAIYDILHLMFLLPMKRVLNNNPLNPSSPSSPSSS